VYQEATQLQTARETVLTLINMASKIKLPAAIAAIYRAVEELEAAYPGRKFTPDGHLLGSIGEVIAREAFGFELLPMSTRSHDARCKERGDVQVKITAGKAIAMRAVCNHLVVLRIECPDVAAVIYDGPGKVVWDNAGKVNQANGQRTITLAKLQRIASGSRLL
jgi:hypothetical protein